MNTDDEPPARGPTTPVEILRVEAGRRRTREDRVVTEEPLEIRVRQGDGATQTVAVTMRTPGRDSELAAGFLYAEGVVTDPTQILGITHDVGEAPAHGNVVTVELAEVAPLDLRGLERHFFASSACGVCGKAGLSQLVIRGCRPIRGGPTVRPQTLRSLPDRMSKAQSVFEATGGLHAAALFTSEGDLLAAREDVGRHNAVDKLIGATLLAESGQEGADSGEAQGGHPVRPAVGRSWPLDAPPGAVLLVSGRASFEIVQKCLMARIPIVAAVSAPSSLAIETAGGFGLTLVAFLRESGFNVYTGTGRIAGE